MEYLCDVDNELKRVQLKLARERLCGATFNQLGGPDLCLRYKPFLDDSLRRLHLSVLNKNRDGTFQGNSDDFKDTLILMRGILGYCELHKYHQAHNKLCLANLSSENDSGFLIESERLMAELSVFPDKR
jgi:hypothetical protein